MPDASEPDPVPRVDHRDEWARQMAAVLCEQLQLQRRLVRLEQDGAVRGDDALDDLVPSLARERDALEAAVAAAAAELAAAEHEVAALRASWSWRLTAPIRHVASWITRALGSP